MKTTTTSNSSKAIFRHFSWIGATTLLGTVMLLQSVQTAQAVTIYTLNVPATVPWTDTGIKVTAGSLLDIAASGTVHYSYSSYQVCDANGGDYTGSQFQTDVMLPSTVCHSLVGKIGGSIAVGDGITLPEGTPGDGPGFVGTSYSKVVPTSGELFLGFNDDPSVFWDNSGAFSVTISITPVPEPSIMALAALGALAFCWVARGKQRNQSMHG